MNAKNIDLILQAFYDGKSQKTAQLYSSDLESFRNYLGVRSLKAALIELFKAPHSQANLTILHYRALMNQNGLKPATINRRLSALRSVTREAQRGGFVQWELDVSNEKIDSGNKKQTIDHFAVTALLNRAESQSNGLKSARDTAILRLLHDLALQISSMVKLDAGDVDLAHRRIFVQVSDNKRKVCKMLPSKTAQALKKWLSHRGGLKGPLFTNCDHAGKGKRLTATSIYRIVRQLGREIGIETSPLGIRQAAIIKALGKARTSGIRLEDVAAFSDHRHISTLKKYDRQRAEVQRRLSGLISE